MLCGWMGIPPSEGIMCRTPVLSFDNVDVVEMFDDTIWYAKDNDSVEYADKIEYLLSTDDSDKTKYALDRLLDRDRYGKNELYANTQSRAAAQYENIFMERM